MSSIKTSTMFGFVSAASAAELTQSRRRRNKRRMGEDAASPPYYSPPRALASGLMRERLAKGPAGRTVGTPQPQAPLQQVLRKSSQNLASRSRIVPEVI